MSVDVDAQNEVEAQIIRRKKLIYQHPNLKKKVCWFDFNVRK